MGFLQIIIEYVWHIPFLVVQYVRNFVCSPSSQLPVAACVNIMSHDPLTVDPMIVVCCIVHMLVIYDCFRISRKRMSLVACYAWKFCQNQWTDKAHVIPGTAIGTWLRLFMKNPTASYCWCQYHVPCGLTTPHRWTLEKLTCVIHMYVLYVCFQKGITCYWLSYCSNISKQISRERKYLVEYRYLSMDVSTIDTAHSIWFLVSYILSKCFSTPPSAGRFLFCSGHERVDVDDLSYVWVYAGRTSPQTGHQASPPQVRSRQAGTAAVEATYTRSASCR